MNEYEKLLASASIAFGFGIASGVLLEKWRERRALRRRILDDYLAAIEKHGADSDEYRRFAILQRVGAWRLNQRELEEFASDVCGRGLRHPFEAWRASFPRMKAFPRDFLHWAQTSGVDLSDGDAAVRRIAEQYDTQALPSPPAGPGVFFL